VTPAAASTELMQTGDNAAAFLALLDKISADKAWWADAACKDADPDLFFPLLGYPTTPAKEICAGCPVREVCEQEGRDERYGVWGGTSVEDRWARRRREKREART
jgi:WhiB family transcriptional regulator, redox-sensing transcriptional regulator